MVNLCLCGCGGNATDRYVTGHDSKHSARLVREVVAGEKTREQALAEIGPNRLQIRFEQHLQNALLRH